MHRSEFRKLGFAFTLSFLFAFELAFAKAIALAFALAIAIALTKHSQNTAIRKARRRFAPGRETTIQPRTHPQNTHETHTRARDQH